MKGAKSSTSLSRIGERATRCDDERVLFAEPARVAQLDRASVFETEGWGFETLRARLMNTPHEPSHEPNHEPTHEPDHESDHEPAAEQARVNSHDGTPVNVAANCIEAVERALTRTPDRELAKAVVQLSNLYTTERGKLAREQSSAIHLAAKSEYFLASDAPKVALALGECVARSDAFARLITLDTVRITDLGAGVGATSVGFIAWLANARAARNITTPLRLDLHAVELGEPAARAFTESVRVAAAHCEFDLALRIEARDFKSIAVEARDLLLCQTALNELLVDATHTRETIAMVTRWANAAPLLLVEPALKGSTRALMALRDELLLAGGMHVVAPCLHQQPCPMLARHDDWCHEARRLERTPRVEAIDKIVGRRDERALFAFLGTAPQACPSVSQHVTLRIVTDTLGSRGKTERLVCRSDGEMRMMRLLDREEREGNRLFLRAKRGAILSIDPLPENNRIAPEAMVRPAL